MSDFHFEWQLGDKVKGFGVVVAKTSNMDKSMRHDDTVDIQVSPFYDVSVIHRNVLARKIKPAGQAKKRYKTEKLAWQQSNIKSGDWVKVVDKSSRFHGVKFQVKWRGFSILEGLPGYRIAAPRVKPCKPQKNKLALGRFSILKGRIYENVDGKLLKRSKVKNIMDSNSLRQVADLIDLAKGQSK